MSYSWFFDIPAMLSGRPVPVTCFPAMFYVPTPIGTEIVPSQFLANSAAKLGWYVVNGRFSEDPA